jgi:hypothetical protein
MAEFKALGSEKLNGDDKLKRILELTYYNNSNKKSPVKGAEFISESKTGGVYGIVKEKDGYYVKRGLNESSLDYIGGMFMKNKNKFSSYAEALKRLELVKGQDQLQEATKYVLKQNKPQEEAPVSEPTMDVPAPMPDDMGGDTEAPMPDDMGTEDSMTDDMGGDTEDETEMSSKPSDYMAEVQKFAGKLGQELRDQKEKMESDDIKYVLNMIISAVNLDNLEEEDIEDIAKKFERDEEFNDEEEMPSEEPEMEDGEEIPSEDDLSEMDSMDALETFINTPMDTEEDYEPRKFDKDYSKWDGDVEEIDLSKYADLGETEDDIQELDLDEIKNEINRSVGETLSKYFK